MLVVLHVVEYGEDAQAILLLTLFVNISRQLDVFWVFTTLQVVDGGYLLAWYILDDMLVCQRLEYFVKVNGT